MVQVDRSRSGLLSDVILAANKRLGVDNLYAFMGGPIKIGFLVPNPDPAVGNDIDKLFESSDPEQCIEFVKKLGKPEVPNNDGNYTDIPEPGPRTELYGRLIIAEDWDGNELKRGVLEEIRVPFDFKIDGEWWTIGESYNCSFSGSPLKIFGAWRP